MIASRIDVWPTVPLPEQKEETNKSGFRCANSFPEPNGVLGSPQEGRSKTRIILFGEVTLTHKLFVVDAEKSPQGIVGNDKRLCRKGKLLRGVELDRLST